VHIVQFKHSAAHFIWAFAASLIANCILLIWLSWFLKHAIDLSAFAETKFQIAAITGSVLAGGSSLVYKNFRWHWAILHGAVVGLVFFVGLALWLDRYMST
jgi:hypothetical protein